MSIQSIDLVVLGPPAVAAAAALLALFTHLVVRRATPVLVVGLLALAAAALLVLEGRGATLCDASGGCAYDSTTPWAPALQLVVLLGTALVLLMAQPDLVAGRMPAGEFVFLLMASASGALLVPATTDLVSLIVALEVVSLPTFALVALRRGDPRAAEGALKVFLFSVSSVAVSLYGLALLYGATGAVTFERLAEEASQGDPTPLATAGIVMLLAVVAFKVAAVPFHFWAPDAYQAADVPVAAYLSVVSKSAGFAALVLLSWTFRDWPEVWAPLVAVVAAVTIVVGNGLALRQREAVRLLAWSSIAQAGYVLVPLGALAGVLEWSTEVVAAVVAYLAAYAAMNLGAFGVVSVARRAGLVSLADYRGLAWRSPALAFALAFCLAALAGLPPALVGLFVKVRVLLVPVDAGVWWLAAAMVIGTVVGVAYYLYWAAQLYRRPEGAVEPITTAGWGAGTAVVVALTLAVTMSVAPSLALGLTDRVDTELQLLDR